eukprot:7466053-Pyramimonas_sp.AAC.1
MGSGGEDETPGNMEHVRHRGTCACFICVSLGPPQRLPRVSPEGAEAHRHNRPIPAPPSRGQRWG